MAQTSSMNRATWHEVIVNQARQQALIGLDAAIAELQEAMGPDQRISARSAILEQESKQVPPHLLGVWNSWDAPLYGKRADDSSIRNTYTPGRKSMFRRWLISSRNPGLTRNMDAAERLCSRQPGERVCLLGEGTLGKDAPRNHYVYADLLYMPLEHERRGGFAWWIMGENQKANIAVARTAPTKHPVEALRRRLHHLLIQPADQCCSRRFETGSLPPAE